MPTIGKYEILEQLGSGSMGTVHKGRDTLLDRLVALKMIRTGVNIELEAKERFYREARTCARLSHPHIVSVYDLGEENGTSFIAMELLKGADFRQLIERREPLPLPVKLIAMAQVCEGLAHAHREGVIHRDIKPSNLFLLADGRAKIVDFGIAKLPTSHLTRSGAVLGTPNYMAPEQIQGQPCDGRADLFSAGIVFFELLTYKHPFQGNLIPQRILESNPDSLFQHDPTLPKILERIFAKALAKSPSQRYATGDEFAADLRTVVDAVAMNASPSFTSVELPSSSSFAVPPTIPHSDTGPVRPIAAGPGSAGVGAGGLGTGGFGGAAGPAADWRAARIQQLLPLLDGQVAARDLVSARASLAELQSVVGLDPRFRNALDHYRAQVVGLEGPGAATSQTGAAFVPPPPMPQAPLAKAPPPKPKPPSSFSTTKIVAIAAAIVVILAAIFILPTFFRTVKVEPFVASARIAAQQGVLHEDASPISKTVATSQRGTLVHVLALPKSLATGWVKIQARDGESYTRAGYVQTTDLIEWESKDPKVSLTLARLSGPMEAGSDAEVRAQIDRFNSVASAFPGKPEATAAGMEAAKLEFILAKRAKDSNPSATEWTATMTDLASRLQNLRANSSVQADADDLLKQIHDVVGDVASNVAGDVGSNVAGKAPPTQAPAASTPAPGSPIAPPTATGAPPSPADIGNWMENARRLKKNYQYNDAKGFLQRVLKVDPKNPEALDLLKKVNAAIELERSAQ